MKGSTILRRDVVSAQGNINATKAVKVLTIQLWPTFNELRELRPSDTLRLYCKHDIEVETLGDARCARLVHYMVHVGKFPKHEH